MTTTTGKAKAHKAIEERKRVELEEPVETVDIDWRGHKFTVPGAVEDWSAATVEAFESGNAMTGVHGALGDGQWKRVSHLPVRHITELFEKIAQAAGLDSAGE